MLLSAEQIIRLVWVKGKKLANHQFMLETRKKYEKWFLFVKYVYHKNSEPGVC